MTTMSDILGISFLEVHLIYLNGSFLNEADCYSFYLPFSLGLSLDFLQLNLSFLEVHLIYLNGSFLDEADCYFLFAIFPRA